jgi:hypothetical protein
MSKNLLAIALFMAFAGTANAQSPEKTNNSFTGKRFSVLFGLNQPLVFKGFNAEVNYWTKKWVFDYSHGVGLHVDGKMIGNEYQDQHLDFKIKHSFGVGVGYRFTEAFNVRLEPKVHIYETYYEGDEQTRSNSIANFTTYTLGLGAYYRWLPFQKAGNALKGITVVPSVRYWQKVGSSLDNNAFTYQNTKTGKSQTFKAPNIGLSNTPFLFNVSVGYTF